MKEKSQLWFACSPFIQVSFLFKQREEREKKRKKRRNQGMETITSPTCLWVVRKNLTSTLVCLFSIYSSFFLVQARRRKGKEEEK